MDEESIRYALSKQLDRMTHIETDYGPIDIYGDEVMINAVKRAIKPILERRLRKLESAEQAEQ